jgi:hypothetical protein
MQQMFYFRVFVQRIILISLHNNQSINYVPKYSRLSLKRSRPEPGRDPLLEAEPGRRSDDLSCSDDRSRSTRDSDFDIRLSLPPTLNDRPLSVATSATSSFSTSCISCRSSFITFFVSFSLRLHSVWKNKNEKLKFT